MTLTKLTRTATALFLLINASVCLADEKDDMDGRTLQVLCSEYLKASLEGGLSKDSTKPFMRCFHYIQGLVETSVFYERMMYTLSGNHVFCFPKRVITPTQAILVTNEYLQKHPEKLDSKGVILVMEAFFEAYSCNK